ncbi:MAG: PilT/PilU family type 4a pilus ATPase [Rickettsiales bacterium]|nr:PilT/PilU family type 4a pilus ATPase [Rickettsiales bacterium]
MNISIQALLEETYSREASDLYLTFGTPPTLRVHDELIALPYPAMDDASLQQCLDDLLTEDQRDEFATTLELNSGFNWQNKAQFRINVFKQRQHIGLVLRYIRHSIPTIDSLSLPKVFKDLILKKRGLVLVVGQTGSGKSTSLASMIGHRNQHGSGHIVTIEDPIEFVHEMKQCIITQRDVGIDTYSYGMALKNTLRQRPDVIVIGEIRDRETMEHAITFSETGHLCLATLHSNNSSQAIERILNFFPEEQHRQVQMNLSINLRAILSQRLVANMKNTRNVVVEVMLNDGLVKELIQQGRIKEIRDVMARNRDQGMQTFDQGLLDLYLAGTITEETALLEADNPSNLRLSIKKETMDQTLIDKGMISQSDLIQRSADNF